MTIRQELRIIGIILMTGAAVGAIVLASSLVIKILGTLMLYGSGVIFTSNWAAKKYEQKEAKEKEKQKQTC